MRLRVATLNGWWGPLHARHHHLQGIRACAPACVRLGASSIRNATSPPCQPIPHKLTRTSEPEPTTTLRPPPKITLHSTQAPPGRRAGPAHGAPPASLAAAHRPTPAPCRLRHAPVCAATGPGEAPLYPPMPIPSDPQLTAAISGAADWRAVREVFGAAARRMDAAQLLLTSQRWGGHRGCGLGKGGEGDCKYQPN